MSFFAEDIGSSNYAEAKLRMYYPEPHPLEFEDIAAFDDEDPNQAPRPASATYNMNSIIRGTTFIPGTQTVLFLGTTAAKSLDAADERAEVGYGEARIYGDDANPYFGTHSVDGSYEYQIWAYDVAEVAKPHRKANGQWQQKRPYQVLRFELPGFQSTDEAGYSDRSKNFGGASFDPVTNRLYVSNIITDSRTVVHVYDLAPAGSAALNELSQANGNAQFSPLTEITDLRSGRRLESSVSLPALTTPFSDKNPQSKLFPSRNSDSPKLSASIVVEEKALPGKPNTELPAGPDESLHKSTSKLFRQMTALAPPKLESLDAVFTPALNGMPLDF